METIAKIAEIRKNIEKVFVGRAEIIELSLVALFSGGHLLVDDIPGVGKTTLAKALAGSIGGKTKRVQFTPDLLPTDITGVSIYAHQTGSFEFHPGPIFTNIFLADEINRATPRAQSSLLEAMEEMQVSVDGSVLKLEKPFMVIATQNPVEIQGTFPLPEAQLDRFVISLSIGYPSREDELRILEDRMSGEPMESVAPVIQLAEVEEIKKAARGVKLDAQVKKYILDISEATRNRDEIIIGASPRATLALMRTSQARAMLQGRSFVAPEDVKHMAGPTLAHRLVLRHSTRLSIKKNLALVESMLGEVPVPRPG